MTQFYLTKRDEEHQHPVAYPEIFRGGCLTQKTKLKRIILRTNMTTAVFLSQFLTYNKLKEGGA
jgi:hypothetical protein